MSAAELDLLATFQQRWAEAVDAAAADPFLTFVADNLAQTWTYAEFDLVVGEVAATMVAHGVASGDRIHLALSNSPAFVAVWLAAVRIGAAIVPSDPRATRHELHRHVEQTEPVLGIYPKGREDDCPSVPIRIAVDELDTEISALRSPARVHSAAKVPWDVPAAIMLTSGTTGQPKGVVVTQANYAFAGDVMAAAGTVGRNDRLLVVLPLFHANAQYYSFAPAISVGAHVVLTRHFSASRFWEVAATHQVTHASLFAAPMRMILARGRPIEAPMALRNIWYAQNISDDEYERFAELAACRPRQLYGMTETVAACLSNRALDPVPSSLGGKTLGCRLELSRVENGVGEIAVRGRSGIELFGGYWKDTNDDIGPGNERILLTGDLARVGTDGRYYFVGRRGDLLKVSGENVSTVEIEAALSAHPDVAEVAVVGEPDEIRDEVPVAHVVCAQDLDRAIEPQLVQWCAERLAPSKRPHRYVFHLDLPHTSVGKIAKYRLVT